MDVREDNGVSGMEVVMHGLFDGGDRFSLFENKIVL